MAVFPNTMFKIRVDRSGQYLQIWKPMKLQSNGQGKRQTYKHVIFTLNEMELLFQEEQNYKNRGVQGVMYRHSKIYIYFKRNV